MIGLDTNVLVRYLAQDDARQSAQATRLIESLDAQNPGFVSLVALVELVWVLESAYAASHDVVHDTLEGLLRSKELLVEQPATVARALRMFAAGHRDFADCLLACTCTAAGCGTVYSFDKAAIRKAGMTPVP
ncbi:MAG: type II toxin-antitoxin system VapC family toxin [Thermomonas sp.]|uniref:PIN domain-containing protein n=1 Tax=Thermomonas sp. TaxID=1971895 RepID=UPI0039E6CC78